MKMTANGEVVDMDCKEMQTPSKDKRSDWAQVRDDPIWKNDEFWEAHKDYYMFWE
jgi:hypothetical protein